MKITGSISQTLRGLNPGVMPIESLIGLPINDPNGNKIGTINYINAENDLWQGTVDWDMFRPEPASSIEIDTTAIKQKEELIEQVKLLGQEVIDQAEDIVGNNEARTSLEIKLSFSQECVPEMKCISKYNSKRYLNNLFSAAKYKVPISISQSGIPLNAVRESCGMEPIKNKDHTPEFLSNKFNIPDRTNSGIGYGGDCYIGNCDKNCIIDKKE